MYHSEISLTQQLCFEGDVKSLKSRHCYTQCEDNNDNSILFYYSEKEFPRKMPLETKTLLKMSHIQNSQSSGCQTRGSAKVTVSCRAGFNLSGKTFECFLKYLFHKNKTLVDKGSVLQTLHSLHSFVPQKDNFSLRRSREE